MDGARPGSSPRLARFAADGLSCLRFYTRLPVPTLAFEASYRRDPFAPVLGLAPLAGAVIGVFGASILTAAEALGLPTFVAAALGLLTTVLVGGGLHEDGLADCADGFGGGSTRVRKLDIMRDSRLGSYGALALGFSLLLRAGCLAGLLDRGGAAVASMALIAGAAVSRGLGLLPLAVLSPARGDGLSHGAGRLPPHVFAAAGGLVVVVGVALPLLAGTGWPRGALAVSLSGLAAAGMTGLARRQIGGHTGDVAGGAQQLAEVAYLLGLLVAPGFG